MYGQTRFFLLQDGRFENKTRQLREKTCCQEGFDFTKTSRLFCRQLFVFLLSSVMEVTANLADTSSRSDERVCPSDAVVDKNRACFSHCQNIMRCIKRGM